MANSKFLWISPNQPTAEGKIGSDVKKHVMSHYLSQQQTQARRGRGLGKSNKSDQGQRACLECRKRRRQCDFERPRCFKCVKTGIECPGYADSQVIETSISHLPGRFLPDRERSTIETGDDQFCTLDSKTLLQFLGSISFNGRELRTTLDDAAEATVYYNERMLSHYFHGEHTSIPHIPPFPAGPSTDLVQNMIIVDTIYDRAAHVPELLSGQSSVKACLSLNMAAIFKQLRRWIASDDARFADFTLWVVWRAARAEHQYVNSACWKTHYRAMLKLIELRGGFGAFLRSSTERMRIEMLIWGIHGATMTHSSKMEEMSSSIQTLAWLKELCAEPWISCRVLPTVQPLTLSMDEEWHNGRESLTCPMPLIESFARINILRRLRKNNSCVDDQWHASAKEVLFKIHQAPIDDWISEKNHWREEWSTLIRTRHASAVLFAIYALGMADELPLTPSIPTLKAIYRRSLHCSLQKASLIPVLRFRLQWSAIVYGFEAESEEDKDFVESILHLRGRMADAMRAIHILRRFWASTAKSEWDDCFDDENAFW